MSHVIAYRCDVCRSIKQEEETVGVSLEQDMFDIMESFKSEFKHQERVAAHYCFDCYERYVVNPARTTVDRKKDEAAYTVKLRELQYNLRKTTVLHYNEWRVKRKKS